MGRSSLGTFVVAFVIGIIIYKMWGPQILSFIQGHTGGSGSTTTTTTPGTTTTTPATPATPATGATGGTGKLDANGVEKIYPDATPAKYSNTTGGGGIEHQSEQGKGAVDRREWEIAMQFLNQEITIYFNYQITNADTMSMKLRGGHHSSSCDACACNYIHYIPVNGSTKYFGAQCPHHNYQYTGKPLFTLPNVANKWVGAKAIEWNEGSGVRCQTWIDQTGTPPGKWEKWIDYLHTGGSDMPGIPVMNKSPWSSPDATILLRTDFEAGGDSQAKAISGREITPPTGGAATTPAPATTPAASLATRMNWQQAYTSIDERIRRRTMSVGPVSLSNV